MQEEIVLLNGGCLFHFGHFGDTVDRPVAVAVAFAQSTRTTNITFVHALNLAVGCLGYSSSKISNHATAQRTDTYLA